MDTQHSSTAATSEAILERIAGAEDLFARRTPSERMDRLRRLQGKIDDFEHRGLLRRQQYSAGHPPAAAASNNPPMAGFLGGRR